MIKSFLGIFKNKDIEQYDYCNFKYEKPQNVTDKLQIHYVKSNEHNNILAFSKLYQWGVSFNKFKVNDYGEMKQLKLINPPPKNINKLKFGFNKINTKNNEITLKIKPTVTNPTVSFFVKYFDGYKQDLRIVLNSPNKKINSLRRVLIPYGDWENILNKYRLKNKCENTNIKTREIYNFFTISYIFFDSFLEDISKFEINYF